MTLTQEEYKQLEAIKVLYPWARWLARDRDGAIRGYGKQPRRGDEMFFSRGYIWGWFGMYSHIILPSLTWESEPLNIDEALKGRGCEFCEDVPSKYKGIVSNLFHQTAVDELYEIGIDTNYCPNCGRRLEESK